MAVNGSNHSVLYEIFLLIIVSRSYGVMVSTLDFESSDPSSNLGRTFVFVVVIDFFFLIYF